VEELTKQNKNSLPKIVTSLLLIYEPERGAGVFISLNVKSVVIFIDLELKD
jgi:hypothetical protein